MQSRVLTAVLLVLALTVYRAVAQVPRVTTAPNELAGRWEAQTPVGDFVGLDLQLVTLVQGRPMTLVGVPEAVQSLSFTVFLRRRGHDLEPPGGGPMGWDIFFSKDDPFLGWDGRHLTVRSPSRGSVPADPRIVLDLWLDLKRDTWTGRFERGDLKLDVVLRRPKPAFKMSLFRGTWWDGSILCTHVEEARDGVFSISTDQVRVPGTQRYAPHLRPPDSVTEFFGQPGTASLLDGRTLQVDRNANAGVAGGQTGPAFLKAMKNPNVLEEVGLASTPYRLWRRQARNSCLR